jgi:hypothetical protein
MVRGQKASCLVRLPNGQLHGVETSPNQVKINLLKYLPDVMADIGMPCSDDRVL